ncbi:AAA family ATPase, partial [Planctomycetota bacterium]
MTEKQAILSPEEIKAQRKILLDLKAKLGNIILGQDDVIEDLVIGFFAAGHILFEGLPGLGKTELVKGLSALLNLEFKRIQFTPDMMPGDITGNFLIQEQEGRRELVFHKGPVFGNIILADEINRASPKTQAAMLEAMQEGRVTVMGETFDLPGPFFVLATQNPIELEGTYPLPEAQIDRFLIKVEVRNVSSEILSRIISERRKGIPPEQEPMMGREEVLAAFKTVGDVYLPPAVSSYIARIIAATHPSSPHATEMVKKFVRYGASTRGAIAITETARVAAVLAERPNVDFADVKRVVVPAVAHRLVLEYAASIENVDARD